MASSDNMDIFDYETFEVLNILNKQNKESDFITNIPLDDYSIPYDLYAPNGIPSLELDGETVIEVKRRLSYPSLKRMESAFYTHSTKYNLLVIYWHKSISAIPEIVKDNGKQFRIISIQDLKGRKVITQDTANHFYVEKNKDWKRARKGIIEEARQVVEQDNNVLFLGAGVGASANMPSWQKLLQSLMGEVTKLKGDTLDAFKQLDTHVYEQCGDSNLIMARYLQIAIRLSGNKDNFSSLIQKYLYSHPHESKLLTNIASIVKQKKVNEVVTYNFDDILEQELSNMGMKQSEDFTTIAKDAEVSAHNNMPIYHVHGIIPETGPTDAVVFSEEEYHEIYKNTYHWSNIEQLHALSRMHCFFVGLSMVDPNLRRLLDISRRINQTDFIGHYAFLRRTKLENYCISDINKACKYVHISESLINKKIQSNIYELNYGVIENMFRDLGVKIIWFEEFDELPGLIAKVFRLDDYATNEETELFESVQKKIDMIRDIEQKIPRFNLDQIQPADVLKFISFKNTYEKEYNDRIQETKEMLNELTKRINTEQIENIYQLQNEIPEYNGNMSGFADFFTIWFEAIKMVLSK